MRMRRMVPMMVVALACGLALGCTVKHDGRDGDEPKNVDIKSPLGGLKVRTSDVKAEDTGIAVYPNAKLVPTTEKDENQANVNIDTPWFGLKVVALKYESEDSPQKVWDFYKKDMARYGRVLECKPGSPDNEAKATGKDELTCDDRDSKKKRPNIHAGDGDELKVGTEGKQRIVAIKPQGKGTEITMVYVNTRAERESQ